MGYLEVIGYVLGIIFALAVSYNALGDKNRKAVATWLANWTTAGVEAAIPILDVLDSTLQPIVTAFIGARKAPAADLAAAALKLATNSLEGKTNIKPADWNAIAGEAMADAFGFGLGSFATAAAFEAAFPEKLNTLNGLGPMLATLSGFDEVTKAAIRPVLVNGIAIPAGYDSNSKFRSRLPALGATLELWARRKITDADRDTLLAYNGMSPDWVAALDAGAYRAVQPRTLVQMFLDQPIDQAQLTAMLQDTAMSPANVQVLSDAITYKSISNVRNAYLSALISGYQKGVVGDDELNQAMTDFNFSPQAQQYVRAHVLILRREVVAAEAEKQVIPQIVAGIIPPETALQQLELAGVQPWYAELVTQLAGVRAEVAVTKKELKAEEKLAAKRQTALQRTALADFANGTLDAAGLGAALIAAGLDPVIAAAVVAEKTATQSGRLRLLYKQLLLPADAKLLTERIDAITAQLKEQLINYQQALAQIKALGVDDADANAIVARTAAAIAAASTVGTLINPLTGQPG